MKRRIIALVLLLATILSLCACSKKNDNSTFSIRFIDVGQGDAALVECDGHYMLIDGGDTHTGQKLYNVLEEQGIQKLDILAISHLHTDHFGGLTKALTYASSIGITISNSTYADSEAFRKFEHELGINGSKITIPAPGDKYELGSSTVEVVYSSAESSNDSLVLLITYGDTRFLFTGDIEYTTMKKVAEKYQNDRDKPYKIDLIKVPHHGAKDNDLYEENISMYTFLRTFMPDYFIISVGENNRYDHPHWHTMEQIEQLVVDAQNLDYSKHVFRTDLDGDIIVRSNGKELSVEPSK